MPDFIARPDGLPPTNGYSHVTIAHGDTVFISGQVPVGADGEVVSADPSAQVEQVFINLGTALAAVGLDFSQVVKLTYYLVDLADLAVVREVRDRFLDPARLPASSLIQVAGLVSPAFRVEIDAVASLG
jgi:enamine deaminase RidA (YjgF/YER057c/UK114 family)